MGKGLGKRNGNGRGLFRRALALKANETLDDPAVRGLRYVARTLSDGSVRQYGEFRYKHPATGKWESKGLGSLPAWEQVQSEVEHYEVEQSALLPDGAKLIVPPIDDFAFDQIRTEARKITGLVRQGLDPKLVAGVQGLTLEQAIEAHIAAPRNDGPLSPNTVKQYRKLAKLYLSDHLKTPLRRLDQATLVTLLDTINKERGPSASKMAGRLIRAAWGSAQFTDPRLPTFPTLRRGTLAGRPARKAAIRPSQLPKFFKELDKVKGRRKDVWLFGLMTGLRPTDLRSVRREDIDLKGTVLHRPAPKGGEERAFDVPLSCEALALAERVLRSHNSEWLFPAGKRSPIGGEPGPIGNIKPRAGEFSMEWSPHDLRRIYASAGAAVVTNGYHLKALLNHAQPTGDTTSGYIGFEADDLRPSQQAITDRLVAKGLPV